MKDYKIVYAKTEGYYSDPKVEIKTPQELCIDDKEALAREFLSTLPADRIFPLFDNLNLSTTQWENWLRKLGYLPANKAEKIPEIEVLVENGVYFNSHNSFSPVSKKDHYYEQALRHAGDFYMQVKFSSNHPFSIAKRNFERQQLKLKEEKAEKKKQREIQKARKILEQNQ
jgi:hypothetical protein